MESFFLLIWDGIFQSGKFTIEFIMHHIVYLGVIIVAASIIYLARNVVSKIFHYLDSLGRMFFEYIQKKEENDEMKAIEGCLNNHSHKNIKEKEIKAEMARKAMELDSAHP